MEVGVASESDVMSPPKGSGIVVDGLGAELAAEGVSVTIKRLATIIGAIT